MPILTFPDKESFQGGCYRFMGRLDDYNEFGSDFSEYMRDSGYRTAFAHPCRKKSGSFFDKEAEGYLNWLFTQSPYRDAFLCTAEEAIQQGEAKVDLDVGNDTLILGLSHLRRSCTYVHQIWNELPDNMNGGLKAILCQVLHPMYSSTTVRLGADQSDDTSTVYRAFDWHALKAWLSGTELAQSDSFFDLGGYEVDFCTAYVVQYSQGRQTLHTVLVDSGIMDKGWETRPLEGLFFKGNVEVRSIDCASFAESFVKVLSSHQGFRNCKELFYV